MIYPQAGDVVRLTGVWPWASNLIKVGSLGMINGIVGMRQEFLEVTFNFSAFRGWSMNGAPERDNRSDFIKREYPDPGRVFVSCSGGPGTIALPASLLTPAYEEVWVWAWCWEGWPQANGGMKYQVKCLVWEWDGKGYE